VQYTPSCTALLRIDIAVVRGKYALVWKLRLLPHTLRLNAQPRPSYAIVPAVPQSMGRVEARLHWAMQNRKPCGSTGTQRNGRAAATRVCDATPEP
jgi:hypothetical protein